MPFSYSSHGDNGEALKYSILGIIVCTYNPINKLEGQLCRLKMLKRDASNRKCFSNYSQSFSHLQRPPAWPLELKELYMRKSLFNPPPGLAESYATRNHIVGAEVPPIEVLESSKRWLLLQTPKYSQNFFTKINSGHFINPFEAILRVFKSFAALGTLCGFYLPSPKMIFVRGKEICVWVN